MCSIDESMSFQLMKLVHRLTGSLQKELKKIDITPANYGVMLVVHENPGITQTEAAMVKAMDKATLGQMVDILESKKLIVREKSEKDRRIYELRLTSEGENIVSEYWDVKQQCEDEIFNKITEQEKQEFIRILKALTSQQGGEI